MNYFHLFFSAILMLSLSACSQLDPEKTFPSYLVDYPGDQLVAEGVLSPEGFYVSLGKTQPPNLPFSTEDLKVSGETKVKFYDVNTGDTTLLTYESINERYVLNQPINPTGQFGVRVESIGLPHLIIEPLVFARPLPLAEIIIADADDAFIVTTRTHFDPDQFVMLQPLVEDSVTRRNASLLLDLDELYLNQCGFNFDMPILSYPNTCFALDTAILTLQHVNSPTGADRFSRPDTGPQRIGVRVGSISASDYQFFTSLGAPNNFFEAYLTEQPLTDYNVIGGFGRIVVLNGPTVWHNL